MKKGDVMYLLDPDDMGSTKVKLMATPAAGETWVSVKFMAPCWNLNSNILVARKGTVKSALISRLSSVSSYF
jgi:hypothetical protein